MPTSKHQARKTWRQNPMAKDEVQGKEDASLMGFVDLKRDRDFSREQWEAMDGFTGRSCCSLICDLNYRAGCHREEDT